MPWLGFVTEELEVPLRWWIGRKLGLFGKGCVDIIPARNPVYILNIYFRRVFEIIIGTLYQIPSSIDPHFKAILDTR